MEARTIAVIAIQRMEDAIILSHHTAHYPRKGDDFTPFPVFDTMFVIKKSEALFEILHTFLCAKDGSLNIAGSILQAQNIGEHSQRRQVFDYLDICIQIKTSVMVDRPEADNISCGGIDFCIIGLDSIF